MKETIEFLKQLQQEMTTQVTDHQASSRFWTVGYYEWVLASEGCGDRHSVYDPCHGEVYELNSFKESFLEELHGTTIEEIMDEHNIGEDEVEELMECKEDDYDFIEWYKMYIDDDIHVFEERKEHRCSNDTYFLTKKECQNHIDGNGYHYLEPHTYARTLFRCPNLEKLMKIVEETDWDKVSY